MGQFVDTVEASAETRTFNADGRQKSILDTAVYVRPTGMKSDYLAVDPGNTATHPERGDDDDDRPAADSARDIVWAATLGADGPTGQLFSNRQPVG
jgi:hypothetical protein